MRIEGASVYILLCADGSYYTGLTRKEVETRVGEHNAGVMLTTRHGAAGEIGLVRSFREAD